MDSKIRFDLDEISTADHATLFLREYIDIQFRNAVKERVKVSDIQETLVAITRDEESKIVALIQQLLAGLPTIERVKLHHQGQELLNEWPERFAANGLVTRPQQYDTMVFQRLSAALTVAFEGSIVKQG